MPEPQPRSNTAEEILDIAEMLIQTRGYSAFSYQDIATKLGIRKASIHYHFPTKLSLGVAVVERYTARIESILASLITDQTNSAMYLFDCYTVPYLQFADTTDRICLCGALAGEFHALPSEMQERIGRFFQGQQNWLARMSKRGRNSGEFDFAGPATRMAATIFSALQGALIIKRATGNATELRDVIAVLKSQLAASR